MTTTETKALNVVIIDDEIDACKNLQKILIDYIDPRVNIAGMINNTLGAEKILAEKMPDLVFLDIEMPYENAFEFLERITPYYFELIFVTAYDEYAVKAFRLNAVDYILKPISIEEVATAFAKAKERLNYKRMIGNHMSTLPDKQILKLDKIRLRDNNVFEIVDFREILYIEAKGSYSNFCFQKENEQERNIITSYSLNEYEELLPVNLFCRIHRSYLVNCLHIKKVIPDDNSFVVMKNRAKLPVSRRRITELMEFFKKQ